MKVIKPTPMSSALLVSSTTTEASAAYNPATTYALNDRVTLAATNCIYQCTEGPSTGNAPDLTPLKWSNKGPTNRWSMFDGKVSTASTANNTLSVTVATGYMNSLALLGLVGASATIVMTDGPGGAEVYRRVVSLDGTLIVDGYQYCFEPSVQLSTLWLTDLPPYINAQLTVTVDAVGPVAIGMLTFGTVYDLGDAQLGAGSDFVSYAKKLTDANSGVTTFQPGPNVQRISLTMPIPKANVNKVKSILASLDNVPCMWIGADDPELGPLSTFGAIYSFGLVVTYQTYCLYSLELLGLI
jgi:hypothetical protein